MALWKHRGLRGGGKKQVGRKKRGNGRRKRKCAKSRKVYGGVGRNTVVPGGKLPPSIVTTKIGSGEFTRRVPI